MALPGIPEWHKIAGSEAELQPAPNGIVLVQWQDKKLCLGRHRGKWYAFAAGCPHAGGSLSDGYIDALGNIACPLHGYKFSLQTGYNTSGEGYRLKRWPVELREDGIYICF